MALTSKAKKKVKSRLCHVKQKAWRRYKNATCATNNRGLWGLGKHTNPFDQK